MMWSLLVGEWRVRQLAVALVCLKPGIGLCLILTWEDMKNWELSTYCVRSGNHILLFFCNYHRSAMCLVFPKRWRGSGSYALWAPILMMPCPGLILCLSLELLQQVHHCRGICGWLWLIAMPSYPPCKMLTRMPFRTSVSAQSLQPQSVSSKVRLCHVSHWAGWA